MDLPQYVQCLSFRIAQPHNSQSPVIRSLAGILQRLGLPVDAINTRLPCDSAEMRRRLRGLSRTSSVGTFAIAAIINRAVAQLTPDDVFLALGPDGGIPVSVAQAGNPDKPCFATSEFGDDLSVLQGRSIGFCHLRNDRDFNPHQGLRLAEPHLSENGCVLVESVNQDSVYRACLDFLHRSGNQYRVLLDQRTGRNCRLTFGNGILLFQLLGRNVAAGSKSPRSKPTIIRPAA